MSIRSYNLCSPANKSRIEYNKKPGKPSTVKVVKDSTVSRDDLYKSGTIHTGPGEPANSVSRKTPKGKPKAAKPVTQGKLLRPGGPGGGPSKLASRPAAARPVPQAQPLPSQPTQSRPTPAQTPRPMPQPVAAQSRPVPQPLAASTLAVVNGIGHSRTESSLSIDRAPPPPPPPAAPPAARKNTFRALYDFNGQSQSELHQLTKDEIIEVLQKESNGMQTVLDRISLVMLTLLRLVARQKAQRLRPRLGPLRIPRRGSAETHPTTRTPTTSRPLRPASTPNSINQRRQRYRSSCSFESEAHTTSPTQATRWRQETRTSAGAEG